MITFLLGAVLASLFNAAVAGLRLLFGKAWTDLAGYITQVKALDGVGVGLGLFDMFVGLDFILWATGFAVFIIITVRFVRLVMGLVSKG
jgi:hypothetical protein